jgi:voltage-gated potassium channel Kch
VLYGDGSRPLVLQSAGVSSPKAVMVMYTGKEKTIEAVNRLRQAFPGVSNFIVKPFHDLGEYQDLVFRLTKNIRYSLYNE